VINAEATNKMSKTVRLILGDQLNSNHSWFNTVDDSVVYVMMEVRSETDYAKHHIQKSVGFLPLCKLLFGFKAKSKVIYIYLNDEDNLQSFDKKY
jgi:deoxyribodipyrimidine photolyase-related protein